MGIWGSKMKPKKPTVGDYSPAMHQLIANLEWRIRLVLKEVNPADERQNFMLFQLYMGLQEIEQYTYNFDEWLQKYKKPAP